MAPELGRLNMRTMQVGELVPAGRRANGDIGYKYLGLKRQHLKPVFWKGL